MTWVRKTLSFLLLAAFMMVSDVQSFECYKCDGKCAKPPEKETCAPSGAPAPAEPATPPPETRRKRDAGGAPAAEPAAEPPVEPAAEANKTDSVKPPVKPEEKDEPPVNPAGPVDNGAGINWKCYTASGKIDGKDKVWKGCTQEDNSCPAADSAAKGFVCKSCEKELCNAAVYFKGVPVTIMSIVAIFLAFLNH